VTVVVTVVVTVAVVVEVDTAARVTTKRARDMESGCEPIQP